jgi:multidrug resistance efflux pump
MNPILEGPKRACLAVAKNDSPVSRSKQRHFDMRFVRLLLILGAFGCGLSYWHERFEHPLTDDAYIQADVIRVAAQVNGPLKKIEIR